MIVDEKQLQTAYTNAPQKIRDYITSPELAGVFQELRTAHKLHLDEAGALSKALNAVFLEVTPFEKFPELLKEALGETGEKYSGVLHDVNEKIFSVFREKMREVVVAPKEGAPAPNISKSAPVLEPEMNKAEQEKESEPIAPIKKLEQSMRESSTDVEMGELTPAPKPQNQKEPTYKSTDPYREPIE